MRYVAAFCVMLAPLSGAVAQMTHEETMVRTAYAKFAYAVQQLAIGDLASEASGRAVGRMPQVRKSHVGLTSAQRLATEQVNFVLGDFVVGDVRDILDRKVDDLVPLAVGEELRSATESYNLSDLGLKTRVDGLHVEWQPAVQPSQAAADLLKGVTVDGMYQLESHKPRPEGLWQRYASYSVIVNYQGKSRGPYRALFLFGHDSKGEEVIEIHDATTSISGLAFALSAKLFPDALVLTHWRAYPVVSDWLDLNQMSGPSCSVGQDDVCCDLLKLKCGPKSEDAAAGLAKTLPMGRHLK
jgi:hypothetical protein